MANFFDLPPEIRREVWALTVRPRTVQIQVKTERNSKNGVVRRHLISPTPVPRVLHMCRESREQYLGFYQKLFAREDTEPTYVWVNFDTDVVDIGDGPFELFGQCAQQVRRLQLKASNADESWYHFTARHLSVFSNVIQYFIFAQDGWECWEDAYNEHFWACVPEELYIIDAERARMMTFPQVQEWMEMDSEDRYAEGREAGVAVPNNLAEDRMYDRERWYRPLGLYFAYRTTK